MADFKTSGNIWKGHLLNTSALGVVRVMVLVVGGEDNDGLAR